MALTYRGDAGALVIPTSAIVRDVAGTAWVYVAVAEHAYQRYRVEAEGVEGALATVSRGLSEGAAVVATGGAELYGVEFGVGK